jgi:hypothetical protein
VEKPIIELPLEWDDANRDHAQRHGVTEDEELDLARPITAYERDSS